MDVEEGTEVTLTATPAANTNVTWGGACAEATGNTCSVTVSADTSATVIFHQGGEVITASVTVPITANINDAEEFITSVGTGFAPGYTQTTSSRLELNMTRPQRSTYTNRSYTHVGLRYTNVQIPQNATITNAYIQFTSRTSNNTGSLPTVTIWGQLTADAPEFTQAAIGDISSRTATSAPVSWTIPYWTGNGTAGAAQRTPNIAGVVQQIIGQAGWQSGNDLVLVVSSTQTVMEERSAYSHDNNPALAPKLVIEFSYVQN